MRILLAGATGVLGRRLLPLLLADGHEVLGLSRHSTGASAIQSAGGMPSTVSSAVGVISRTGASVAKGLTAGAAVVVSVSADT